MSLEQGAYPAFGIGVPLAIWSFMSYLRGNARTKRENESSSSANQERQTSAIIKHLFCSYWKALVNEPVTRPYWITLNRPFTY